MFLCPLKEVWIAYGYLCATGESVETYGPTQARATLAFQSQFRQTATLSGVQLFQATGSPKTPNLIPGW